MRQYIWQQPEWPKFKWKDELLVPLLVAVSNKQGRISGRMESLGFGLREEAVLTTLTLDILKSNEIEGEHLNQAQVRSSLARRLGMEVAGLVPSERHIDGVVEMMLDATQKYNEPLTDERLFGWHSCMFPAGRSGMYKITTGDWRAGGMQVVSGQMGNEKVHFEAPSADALAMEMNLFLEWFNSEINLNPVLKAAISHFWFVTIHPFEDGNGRIARAIADMQLARADRRHQRFYSMSAQIQKERGSYYHILEITQRGDMDITGWLVWFLQCLDRALLATNDILSAVLNKANFWNTHAQAGFNPRQILMLNKLLDGFEGKLTTAKWAKIAKCSHDTALRDIQNLLDNGVLGKDDGGGRSAAYILVTSL